MTGDLAHELAAERAYSALLVAALERWIGQAREEKIRADVADGIRQAGRETDRERPEATRV